MSIQLLWEVKKVDQCVPANHPVIVFLNLLISVVMFGYLTELSALLFLLKVMHFNILLASLAQEAVEKICQLFEESSSVLRLEVGHQLSPSVFILNLSGSDFKALCWCCRCRRVQQRSKT